MTGQLSLFDWIEPATSSAVAAANKPIEQTEPTQLIEDSDVVKKPIETETGITEDAPVKIENNTPSNEDVYVGQIVRIALPQQDTELYDYLIHYYPHVINKTGEIEGITYNNKGDCICSVNVRGTKLLFHTSELVF